MYLAVHGIFCDLKTVSVDSCTVIKYVGLELIWSNQFIFFFAEFGYAKWKIFFYFQLHQKDMFGFFFNSQCRSMISLGTSPRADTSLTQMQRERFRE